MNVAISANKTLDAAYNNISPMRPSFNNCRLSAENAENVVKPPHNPVASNRWSDWKPGDFDEKPITRPMIRLPTTFTVNVAIGKG